MKFFVFGATNPTGAAFLELAGPGDCTTCGRTAPLNSDVEHMFLDISEKVSPGFDPLNGVLVSFAPIWLFSEFLTRTARSNPEKLRTLSGIVACSSSSFLTKRFAFCSEDQLLALKLRNSHYVLESFCSEFSIDYQILAPTLVYGYVNGYKDKNISKLIGIMRQSPFIALPERTGMRQPIHAKQLAMAALVKAERMYKRNWNSDEPVIQCLGGDEMLSYYDMLIRLRTVLSQEDKVNRCIILKVPERLFDAVTTPVLPVNPKMFEAIMRIKSDLSGFTKVHQVIDRSPQDFPMFPLPT